MLSVFSCFSNVSAPILQMGQVRARACLCSRWDEMDEWDGSNQMLACDRGSGTQFAADSGRRHGRVCMYWM